MHYSLIGGLDNGCQYATSLGLMMTGMTTDEQFWLSTLSQQGKSSP
ncbi:hypothetical protein [Moraxella sp. VT-16-12]|nr:hypothetical protein [Moraxella sp. VT-16-12]